LKVRGAHGNEGEAHEEEEEKGQIRSDRRSGGGGDDAVTEINGSTQAFERTEERR